MKATPVDIKFYKGNCTYVESLSYDLDTLKIIIVAESNKRIEVTFKQPIGFRCLDEGDLLEFWKNPKITNNWLIQIHDSGWFEQESKRPGFLSKDCDINEYLIKGKNECVNVLDVKIAHVRQI